ncbi:hypothetical protein BDV93DRAFT_450989 [Ceratobasidium sp. AG-I]|nr:hypothetical protein BDV93DRAFT_450989 [Ceratobasidium sp. AG-I]
MLVSVSSRFNPGEPDIIDADLVLFTTDNAFFYVHGSKILRESKDHFGGLVPESMNIQVAQDKLTANLALSTPPTLLAAPYLSDVLNIVLHLVYGLSFQTYQPSLQILHAVIPALQELGYAPHAFFTPNSEMFNLMVQAAVADPLSTYALAAQHALEPLAVAVSALTLPGGLCDVDDHLARQMGPKYLKRLFFLHLGRADALKRLLLPPPILHSSNSDPQCTAESQKSVSRAWALACAYIVVEGRLDSFSMSLLPPTTHLRCEMCRRSMEGRVASLIKGWNEVKRTI